jgi:uncharacterized metal-binding protein (TIGR02443 family)
MAYSSKRRFIAGAVCPRCSAMDTVVVYRENEKDYRECISCGFKDEMHFKPQPKELPTRVTDTAKEQEQHVEVVKILPFK